MLINTVNFVFTCLVDGAKGAYVLSQYRKHGADNATNNADFVKQALPHELAGTMGTWDGDYCKTQTIIDYLGDGPHTGNLETLPSSRYREAVRRAQEVASA